MKRIVCALTLSLVCLVFGGCSSFEISDQPLQGQIGGQPWIFVAGDTSAFLSDSDAFFAELAAEEFEACGFGQPNGNSAILSIPTTPGDYDLSLQRNMTFVVDSASGIENLVATKGRIIVDEVTTTTVSGGIHARYDDANEIDGNFTVTICPPQ